MQPNVSYEVFKTFFVEAFFCFMRALLQKEGVSNPNFDEYASDEIPNDIWNMIRGGHNKVEIIKYVYRLSKEIGRNTVGRSTTL